MDRAIRLTPLRDGLVDAARVRGIRAARGLVLFGHLQMCVRHRIPTPTGVAIDVGGASGAAVNHRFAAVRAGFDAYVIADHGSVASADAHVVASDGRSLERMSLPGGEGA